ncbi:hypothetical protein [Paenibacillus larvae]|uniref:Uncharacterized protein n=1 Tax=Paenibacillus larvae subsp. larvae TaxID=147375 RepID=A0A6C0QZ50_9BACL|nr:hypothetical protein [Paenibacillus larvae]QHZ54003.1 hypothetical protein ERICV_05019 [Paenibacillus larvae subsp. larvae]
MKNKELIKNLLIMTSLIECPKLEILQTDIYPESLEKIGDIVVELMHMSEKDVARDITDLFEEIYNKLIEEYDRRLELQEKEVAL